MASDISSVSDSLKLPDVSELGQGQGRSKSPHASELYGEIMQTTAELDEEDIQTKEMPGGAGGPPDPAAGGEEPPSPREGQEPEKLPPLSPLAAAPEAEDPSAVGAVTAVAESPGEEPAGRWAAVAKLGQSAMCAADSLPSLTDCPACPSLNVFSRLSRLPGIYCDKLGKYPWVFAGLNSLVLIILVSVLWRKLEVNTDVGSFYKVDSHASMYQDVYAEALRRRKRDWSGNGSVEGDTFQLTLLYQVKDDSLAEGRILSEAALRDIQSLEQELLALDGWSRICGKSQQQVQYRCQPGETLGNYVWPTRQDMYINASGEFGLSFWGTASESLSIPAVLAYLDEAGAPLDKLKFLPLDGQGENAKELRSVFTFTAPVLDDAGFREQYGAFVRETLYPKLLEVVERSRETPDADSWDEGMSVTVFFSGDLVDEHEVRMILESDMKKAIGGLVFAFVLAWVQLGSLFLALFGTWLLCMAPLLTWCVLPVVDQAGLATFLGVFLTFGLGGNVLYYTASAWDRTAGECHASVGDRVLAVHRAALLRLLPPLASGGCFLVLLASLLRPLREMGLFAGVCAVCSCALCLAIFVPLLVLRERSLAPRLERSGLPGWLKAALEPQACAAVPWERAAAGCVQVAAVRGKWLLVGAAVAVFIMFCITVGVTAVSDGGAGLPEVFSPDHPRAARRAVEEVFAAVQPSVEQGPQETKFCEPHVDSECGLFWCNTLSSDLGRPKDTTGAECTCHREGDGACSRVTVRTRLSGSDAALQGEDDLKLFVEDVVNSTLGLSAAEWADAPDAWPQRTLALEHWLFGEVALEPLLELPPLRAGTGADECEVRLTCHCGARACDLPADAAARASVSVSHHELASARRLQAEGPRPTEEFAAPSHAAAGPSALEAAGRRLQQRGGTARSEVNVVFGIAAPETSSLLAGAPAWGFDPKFNASSPAAQRAIYKMCSDAAAAGLRVESSSCWIEDFKSFLEERGEVFPTCRFCSFDQAVQEFLEEHPARRADIWLDSSDKVVATVISFAVDHGSGTSEVLQGEKRWRSYVTRQNAAAESTANGAWATSVAWVDAEAHDEALASSWRVVLVTLLLLSVVGLVYTMDFRMTGAVLGLTFCCVVVLHFLMYCIFQWDFGPWELVITVVFLCYAMEPAFQIGHLLVDRSPAEPEGAAQDPEREASAGGRAPPPGQDPFPQEGPRAAGSGSARDSAEGLPELGGSLDVRAGGEGGGAGALAGQDVVSRVTWAVHQVVGDTAMVSLQLWICGCFLASCESRLFSRLGFLAVVSPLLWLPAVLVLFPAFILCSSHAGKGSDVLRLWSASTGKLQVLIS